MYSLLNQVSRRARWMTQKGFSSSSMVNLIWIISNCAAYRAKQSCSRRFCHVTRTSWVSSSTSTLWVRPVVSSVMLAGSFSTYTKKGTFLPPNHFHDS
jgi:hypothetical protein